MGRQRRQEGIAKLEWGQEGRSCVREARFREKMGMWLAPRYEQAPPCHRTLSSSDSEGSQIHFPVHSPVNYPVCWGGGAGQVRRGVKYDSQLLQPGSPTLSSHLFRSFISAECEAPVEHRREEPHHASQLAV